MEYKKTKRTNQFIFESSKHAAKRQKINVNSHCKGILLSPVNPRKMSAAIKEFLNFLKINYPNNYENGDTNNNENDVKCDLEKKNSNVEKQLNDEIDKANLEYQRFVPLRNIIKNFAFIKFNNTNDKDPSYIVTQIFSCAQKKNEKYKLRNICKIIPFDCICKPHLSPFIKTIVPLIKENFSNGICVQENFSVSHILKLLNISGEKEKEEEEETEIETQNEDEKNEEKKEKENEAQENENNERKVEEKEDNEKENEAKKNENNEKEIVEKEDDEKKKEAKKNENNEKEIVEKEDDEKKKEAQKNENNEKKIQNTTKEMNESNKKISWGLVYKCSNTKTLTKRDVLTVLDNCIGNNYCVNLTKPDLAIIVYVTEIMCGISIIKDYDKTRKFNISSFNEDS
ncbi:conserved Plasmodium protein, unknown function [Plasmodium relictum]|uniref:THUMP domain-containing protein n=1 Tax=Plasmodium relictum TaxID=85471 RepID=A0A1J1HBS9_PLARL|nr:conserved Plasmodium protein, unknown function [Plasmodium relictum]CRH02908.1 conserved Plasmodium protein, unknown function [Plasmodium relictum]